MKGKEKISIVIPCYASENTIDGVVEEVKDAFEQNNQYDYEIILINDGSPDHVWDRIMDIVNKSENITGILFSRNFGQHAALMAGYGMAEGDIIITLDDDGQSPVDELFSLVEKIREGYDVVYGIYPQIKQTSFRIFGSWVNDKMSELLLEKPKGIKGNSFYAMKRYVLEEIIKYKNAYPYVGGLVFRTTKNITNVMVHQRERVSGKSGYTLRKLLKLWMNGFTAFSEKPLRMATISGLGCAGLGFAYGIITVVNKWMNPSIQAGYSSIMAVLLFVGGVLMMLLGLIGEYIGRIYVCINNAPQYIIKEVLKKEKKQNESQIN